MRRDLATIGSGLAFAMFIGCSNSQPPSSSSAAPSRAQPPRPATSNASRATGTAPRSTSEIPVIIVLDPKTPHEWPAESETPVMDQVSLTFTPPLLFVRAGQPSEFRNSDETLHNVHVTHEDTHEPQFNVAIPTGEIYRYTFKRDGIYHVGCDIHPPLSAATLAATDPFVVTAAADGPNRRG